MIKNIRATVFSAVPYLESSLLMQAHPEGIVFSTDKPNVIVGPNGAGKSALLTALALHTLSFQAGVSAFDDNYTGRGRERDLYWSKEGYSWNREYTYLPGLTCDSDLGPAMYYRPGHIPGGESFIAAAMMSGYCEQARNYGELTRHKSSGQKSQAVLQKVEAVLAGDHSELGYQYMHWSFGKELKNLEAQRWSGDYEYHAETLKKLYGTIPAGAIPVLLLDEPEQSLDAKAEALLWKKIAEADMSRVQVIVATHSLYPLMHPEKFNLIEAVSGYAQEVQALL